MMETHSKQLVLVEGLSGAGKSHFVASLIRSSSEFGWIYIHAKFDPQSQPLSVVTSAFNRFFINILANRSEQEYVARVIASLQTNLSSSAIVSLCNLLPTMRILFPSVLRRVVSDEDLSSQSGVVVEDEFASGSQMSRIRLHFIFRKLISALCSVERPLALFFDDLQWADDRCMELLSALMDRDHLQELDDNDGTNCLFIGSFRSNETNDNLLSHFDNFEQSTLVDVTKIELGGLAKVESNNMVSEVLRLPARLTSPLNELVQRKTTGNPFHIIHFMQSLVKDSILNYSLSDKRWVWDIEAVKSTSIDKTVLELLARKLSQLPDNIVDGLKVLSCLGPKVDDTIMKYLYTSPESRNEFIACLDLAVGENILEKSGDSAYSFVHDMLKQSAYAVMSEEEKGEKHFWIGMHLIANASADTDEFNAIIFSIVDQINAANTYGVTEEALHMNFAELNLKAGKTSIDVSDFQSALSYMKAGVSLLNGWQDGEYYDMSLQLYETAALVSYLNTDIGLMQQYLEILFENAKCFEDRLHGYLVMIQSLLSNGKHVEAMKKILFILEGKSLLCASILAPSCTLACSYFDFLSELGESISINATPKEVYIELMSTKALLDTISSADVINGKRMADKGLRWRLRFMQLLNTPLYMLQPHAIHVTACRTVKLSVEHGFCSDSAVGLQIYGFGVLNIQNDVEECLKWNHTALSLVKSLGAKQMIPRVTTNVNILAYWKEPLQANIESLKENHHELLMVGDLEILPLNALHCCRKSLLCGRNLLTAQRECAALLHEMHQLRQMNALIGMISNHLSILKLIGSNYDSEEPLFRLLGNSEINSLDELLQFCKSNRLVGPTQQCYFDRLMLAFWSQNY
jgi:predicted ATPase